MVSWPPISRDDLKVAASSAGFDMVFPLLVRRLIMETAALELSHIDMPGGSGTASGGFDGIVVASSETPFVPSGTSVWELSVGGGQIKADDDYSKRDAPPEGLQMADVTYVEAILVPWTKARTWEKGKSIENRWREVRGYNLDRIHAWLDAAPATTIWLANQLGKNPPGVMGLQDWWTNTWLTSTKVPLDRAIVLAGRESAAEALINAIASGRRAITLSGDLRPEDARAFVAAALASSQSPDSRFANARALFVSDADTLAQLVTHKQPMILLLSDPSLARELPGDHPHQLIMTAAIGADGAVAVPRVHSQVVAAQLSSEGVDRERAARLGTLAHRSLAALRRSLAQNPEFFTPPWASQPNALKRRLLLAGAWDNQNANDREAMAALLGRPFSDLEDQLPELLGGNDIPFLGKVGETYHVLSIEDAWTLLASTLTTDDLSSFNAAVVEVLGERDPTLDLEPGSRWRAGFDGIQRRYSAYIRAGLAQSLALLGATNATVGVGIHSSRQYAEQVVSGLLARSNADESNSLWLSLIDVLHLLAEAAPESFIDALKTAMARPIPLQESLFPGEDVEGFGKVPDFYSFLGALEAIAWSPDYLDDAADVVASLAEADQLGTRGKRPLASLGGILSAWSPNTNADARHRLRSIRRIVERHPAIAHRLLMALMPNSGVLQPVHPRPKFRDWEGRLPVNRDEMHEVLDPVINLLIDGLDSQADAYADLIDKTGDLSPEHRSRLAEKLVAFAESCE